MIKTAILITTLLIPGISAATFKNIEIQSQTKFHYLTDRPEVVIKFNNNQPVEEFGYTDRGILKYKRMFKDGIITEFREYTLTGDVDSISKYKNGQITMEEVYFEGTKAVETKTWIDSGFLDKIVSYREDGSMSYAVEKNNNGELIRTIYGINGVIVNEFRMPTPFPAILLDARKTNTGDFAEYYDNGVIHSFIKVEYLDPKLREEKILFLQDSPVLVETPELNLPEDYKGSIFAEGAAQKDGSSSFSIPQGSNFPKSSKKDRSYGSEKIITGSFGIDSAIIKPTINENILAVTFNIENNTEEDLRLETASIGEDGKAVLLTLKMYLSIKSTDGVVVNELDSILIPARTNIKLSTDNLHLVLMLANENELKPEDIRSIKLGFDNGEYIDISPSYDESENISESNKTEVDGYQVQVLKTDNSDIDAKSSVDNNKKPKKIMSDGKLIAEEFYDSTGNLNARVEYSNGKKDRKIIFDEYGLIDTLFTKYEDEKWKE